MKYKPGDAITVALAANATAGEHWHLISELNQSVLKLVSRKYEAPKDVKPGARGKDILTFEAVGPGVVEVVLQYSRAWEIDVPPAKTHTVTLEVG